MAASASPAADCVTGMWTVPTNQTNWTVSFTGNFVVDNVILR